MKPTLILFARAPRLGTVKTRLARDIGRLGAFTFYRDSLTRTLRRFGTDRRWRCIVAGTPDGERFGRLPGHADVIRPRPQGRGDLGKRMARAMAQCPPGPALIVGTDIPGLEPGDIAAAIRLLGRHEAVFGPAEDGGYWLVGLARRRSIPRTLFGNVRWSGPHALEDTLAGLPKAWRVGFLSSRADIDDGADYRAWKAER